MTYRYLVAGVLAVSCVSPRIVVACGDKFLVVNRGTRFDRPTTRRPAAVLVYAKPASDLTKTLAALPVEATLRKAGYQPSTVASERELDDALAAHTWDLVLADALDVRAIRQRLSRPSPVVVPVVYGVSVAGIKQLKAEFPSLVRAPNRSQNFLDAVEDALRSAPRPPKGSE
ncbi:MAG TPA: hypothetical protein VHZ73_09140 [Vicinamibacterales bacterium]|jgi:hypothetical protein|nr:hypothetical protein [Vicinamibacterales bacterium]